MKHKIQLVIPIVAILLTVAASQSVYADLNAREIRDRFNSMNGGQGFSFIPDVLQRPTLLTLTTQAGSQNVDTSAYISGRKGSIGSQTFFQTFCVSPQLDVCSVGLGKLNYDETTGLSKNKQGNGYALTLGAAYLYKEFATSLTPLGITGEINPMDFAQAIRALMATVTVSDWDGNIYLKKLLSINDDYDYWRSLYHANQRYSEIGDYCVFVINVTDSNGEGEYQDFLYIARAEGPPVIPEPATLLLWSLGSLGLFGTSLARKRRMKKLIIS